jgi:imidazolonepropionase-like amidohydrolase
MIAFLLAQTIAITGATVYPVSGPKVENATVLIRDGRIAAVGANVTVPAGATRIDASGKWVTPGFIDGASQMGLREIGAVDATNEYTQHGTDVAAAFNVLEGINPASTLIAVNRMEGITSTLAVPGYLGVPQASGGLIWGQAALIDLDGTTIEAMQIKSPAAMVANLSQWAKDAGGGSRAAVAQRLRRVLTDAREYATRRADYRRRQIQDLSASAADLEALQPVLRGELPLLVLANRRSDIETALRIAREYRLKLILAGAAEGWMIPGEIAAAGVPVLVEPLDNIPSYDGLGIRYENAGLLAKNGAKVVLMETTTENTRDLRQQAGNAVANGMTWEQALRAVTLTPAEAFGVADRYGSLEVGKVANVVVWTGDPFEFSTGVEHVYIRGREIPLRSRQTELLERYRTLPPKY